jgi:hypothetical protein
MATQKPIAPMAVLSFGGHYFLMEADRAAAVAAVLLPAMASSRRLERDWAAGSTCMWKAYTGSGEVEITLHPVSSTQLAELALKGVE